MVKLIAHTNDPEKLVAVAARICYSNDSADTIMDSFTDKKINKFIDHLMSLGHESPLEHVSFTFVIDSVSRALLAQITRHRIASFSVRSQRYCEVEDTDSFVIPENNKALYKKSYDSDICNYKILLLAGEKKEDARMVLPNATDTVIMVTMNARELMHFFNLRCCTRAQWEIREVANEMLKQVKEVAPHLFKNAGPTCNKGYCPEGKMSCGKAPTLDTLIDLYNRHAKKESMRLYK